MKSGDVQDLLEKSTEAPGFGLFQAPYVNIIQLNMWLDEATKKSPKEKR